LAIHPETAFFRSKGKPDHQNPTGGSVSSLASSPSILVLDFLPLSDPEIAATKSVQLVAA
jgi:hypothetical protein